MAILASVWLTIVVLAVITTGIAWYKTDRRNYTNAICGLFSVLLWFIAGLNCLTGIQTDYATFTAGYLFWIFAAAGILQGVITVLSILDIATSRERHVEFGDLRL